jgi:hypothetical protein
MNDKQTTAIVGLKNEIKMVRASARAAKSENARWRSLALTLRKLAGLDDERFNNLLRSESLPSE